MRLHPAEWIRESAGYMKEKNKTGNWLLIGVYARVCPICDGVLSGEERYLCRNCVVNVADEQKVVLEGLDGYIVAEKNGRLLVCRLNEEQRIKEFSQA